MTLVIDLLSSSPPKAETTKTWSSPASHLFHFDTDDFDDSDVLQLRSVRAPKRRKIDHLPEPTGLPSPKNDAGRGSALELSSDIDLPSLPSIDALGSVIDRSSRVNDHDLPGPSHLQPSPNQESRKATARPTVLEISSDDDGAEGSSNRISTSVVDVSRPMFSSRTTNLLAKIGVRSQSISANFKVSKATAAQSAELFSKETSRSCSKPMMDEIEDSSSPPRPSVNVKSKGKEPSARSASRCANSSSKSARKALSEADKAAIREKKRHEKEQRDVEKLKAAAIAKANKARTHKKDSTTEMIIDIPASLRGKGLGSQVQEYMEQLGVECSWSSGTRADSSCEHANMGSTNIIRWRRKIAANYDENEEIWQPLLEPQITIERHLVLYLTAEEFLKLAVTGTSANSVSAVEILESAMKSNLDKFLESFREEFIDTHPILLLEGLTSFLKRSQTAKNRAYTAAVRSVDIEGDGGNAMNESVAPASTRRRKTASKPVTTLNGPDISTMTEEMVETLLLHLQLRHQPLQIHHTTCTAASANQISAFTQHLSTRPYRLAQQSANINAASFCMTTGQIKTGATPHETWINMLQEINRVTPSMAYGISGAGYTNPTKLVHGFERAAREDDAGSAGGKLMLEDVRKSVNKDGGWSDRRLGPMVSKRVWKVFMGRNPDARDGIA